MSAHAESVIVKMVVCVFVLCVCRSGKSHSEIESDVFVAVCPTALSHIGADN